MDQDSSAVTVVITCLIKAEKLDEAKAELDAVGRRVMEREPGCHGIRVCDDPDNERRLLIIEEWESKEIFLGPHMQTPHMQDFLKTAESFLDGTAEFTFWHEISKTP